MVKARLHRAPAVLIVLTSIPLTALMTRPFGHEESAVHPLFDLSSPATSPFPSDRFTVTDPEQNTGRRVNLPLPPDCVANQSDCHDLSVINQLDGFHQHPRVSVPFDGDIDPETARGNIFLVEVPDSVGGDNSIGTRATTTWRPSRTIRTSAASLASIR